ncbi:uncharacterized protein BX663DRAFT_482274 [Cokeromyces recurvatus]|uniref:uncharacterized protein n=1 Tax=Cokeromyces recurvatus TaxID=90255 RepID=UPI00222068E2|nr:uncharacterized protein BX663DRAFT_482274 [Cokeromyces recurvatus]KAI7908037.1 hypothetical protein BX663DRAFT_482274 [Cokeromyces recurvatus]
MTTRGMRKKPKAEIEIIEADPIATKIKNHAHAIYKGKIYNNLPVDAQTAICLGFNSTLDLSNNSETSNNQRHLFNEDEWEKIKNDYDAKVKFEDIPESIMTELKEIEHLAEGSLTKAYQECLMKQAKYAFTKEETYFKIYAHVTSVMKLHPEYLEA